MKKWHELFFGALMNYSVALMAGGLFGLVLDDKSPLASSVILFFGVYLLIFVALLTKNKEE